MKEWLILFLKSFLIILAGFILCNICAVTMDCLLNGFNNFRQHVFDLPYLLYVCLSVGVSAIFTITAANKTKR